MVFISYSGEASQFCSYRVTSPPLAPAIISNELIISPTPSLSRGLTDELLTEVLGARVEATPSGGFYS